MRTLASQGFLSVVEMRLDYRLFGETPARAPTIVMLHEGLGSIGIWGEFPRLLHEATGMSVFAYSRDGYGASPLSQPHLPIDYIRRHALKVLPRILDEIGFSRGILLGHSDGASMTAAYAGTIDDPRVRGLVVLAPHFCVEEETLAEIRNARVAFETRDLRQRLSRHHSDVDAAFLRWNNVWLEPEFKAFNLADELGKIRVPTLVIRGEGDRYGTHRQVRMAEEFHRGELTTLELADCGHLPHREQTERTLAAIKTLCGALFPA